MDLTSRLASTPLWKFFAKYYFPIITRQFRGDDLVVLNWGYEEEPPMAVPLASTEEPDRFGIQLYHRVATQLEFGGKRVLEVSCGHGGGASHLVRTLHPASYTGLDLNRTGIEHCRKIHNLPGLEFVHGNAENLPFADQSFDVVINIEASHGYPSLPRFLAEVARVLRPGGHFVYADVRRRDQLAQWDAELADAPMRLLSHEVINEQVARGQEKSLPRFEDLWARHTPKLFRGVARNVVRTSTLKICRGLRNGDLSYRMYCFGL